MQSKQNMQLKEVVDHYMAKLRAGDFEAAFFGLIDMDQDIVRNLMAVYRSEKSPELRADLLQIIQEFRTPLALPVLAEALLKRDDAGWKIALDGLVSLGHPKPSRCWRSP